MSSTRKPSITFCISAAMLILSRSARRSSPFSSRMSASNRGAATLTFIITLTSMLTRTVTPSLMFCSDVGPTEDGDGCTGDFELHARHRRRAERSAEALESIEMTDLSSSGFPSSAS
ncbi:hypothetical protein AB1Y20_000147 [Prymnesium parvum]|uniref:Secreted protein n=1 Tax=Prymnesium parvum TaxID=97485 RepID=A0AB34K3S8_PRYPA